MRRTTNRRPIRITESKLRQIISETIEQELIQEGVMLEKLKQAATAALIALGITVTPAAVSNMVKIIQRSAAATTNQDMKSAHLDSINKKDEVNKLVSYLIMAQERKTTAHPNLRKSDEMKKKAEIAKIRAKLQDSGLSDKQIDDLVEKQKDEPSMY